MKNLIAITSIYAALLGLLFVLLSVRTLRLRRQLRVAFGDGDNLLLRRAIRVHANFAEYVPLALLLMCFNEIQSAPALWVHGLGALLLAGRTLHATGGSQLNGVGWMRVMGVTLTLTELSCAASFLLLTWLRSSI